MVERSNQAKIIYHTLLFVGSASFIICKLFLCVCNAIEFIGQTLLIRYQVFASTSRTPMIETRRMTALACNAGVCAAPGGSFRSNVAKLQ